MVKIRKEEKQINTDIPADMCDDLDSICEMFKKKQVVGAAIYHFIKLTPKKRFELINQYLNYLSDQK